MHEPRVSAASVSDLAVNPSLNVVMTVRDMEAARTFYGDVLGLTEMPPTPLDPETPWAARPVCATALRYRVGTHELELLPGLETTKSHPGGVDRGIGIRLVNFPIPEVEAFLERLAAHGYDPPAIRSLPGTSYRFGLLEDPDGNAVEFFYHEADEAGDWRDRIQVALTVGDLAATERFYGEVLGIGRAGAVPVPDDPDREVHLFPNGPTLLKVFAAVGRLPNCAGGQHEAYGYRCIEHRVRSVSSVEELIRSRCGEPEPACLSITHASISTSSGKVLRVADPDGIVHQFVEEGESQ